MFQKYVGKFLAFFPTGSRLGAVGWKRFIFIIPKSCQYPQKTQSTKWCFEQAALWKKNMRQFKLWLHFSSQVFFPSTVKMAPKLLDSYLYPNNNRGGLSGYILFTTELRQEARPFFFLHWVVVDLECDRHISGPRGFFHDLIPGVLNNRYTVGPYLIINGL